ncbi:hypothetical protein J437_LFUL015462 [Ladona fulva]|uniref:YAP binding domain-containing protein n=1 Tax=Ladona fulva TaxID=123851 RepID=A0A8K0P8N0_LADFU|nr:hypothetical protein J437_LFUL015462 [Ladona fulva]
MPTPKQVLIIANGVPNWSVKPFASQVGGYGVSGSGAAGNLGVGPGSKPSATAVSSSIEVGAIAGGVGGGGSTPGAIGGLLSSSSGSQAQPPPPWEGRAIATHKLRLVEFSAFMEQQRDPDTYQKHLFVHIGGSVTYADPLLEAVDVRQIYDKFPEKKGGLKELYDKGPQNAFFLVKFWADLNTNIQDEAGAFYGVVTNRDTTETLLCTAYVFEVSTSEHGAQHHIYRLVKD